MEQKLELNANHVTPMFAVLDGAHGHNVQQHVTMDHTKRGRLVINIQMENSVYPTRKNAVLFHVQLLNILNANVALIQQ